MVKNNKYYIYIIECINNKLYTGITTNIKRRFEEHKQKKQGAKFTKIYKPQKVVLLYETIGRSNAQKLEYRIKKLKKEQKIELIENKNSFKLLFNNIIDIKLYKRLKIID